jgi:hypothetical protein
MALDVSTEIQIDRPADEVAAYQFEPGNDPNWIGGVSTVELLTDRPVGKGSRVLRKGSFMGRPIEWLMEVVDFEPGRRVAMHALRSPFPMDVTYELQSKRHKHDRPNPHPGRGARLLRPGRSAHADHGSPLSGERPAPAEEGRRGLDPLKRFGGLETEVAEAIDDLLGRAAADPQLHPAASDEIGRFGVFGHVRGFS